MDEELYHYGVKGMKWGVRRTPAQLGHKTGTKKKKTSVVDAVKKFSKKRQQAKAEKTARKETKKASKKKKSIAEMSDAELRERISRLELEKRYRDLSPKQTHRGRDFVMGVMENSARNIATQTTTYAMGTMVNRIAKELGIDEQMVNPKKGQKDK